MNDSRRLMTLFAIVVVKAFLMGLIVLYAGIGLGPDEAQYWTWSRELDWGYYSKPPGIAWEIWLGTSLFGNTEFGVRFFANVIGMGITLLVYGLARSCRLSPVAAFWSGVAFALSPLGILSSFLAITDGGLVLFWSAVCMLLAAAIEEKCVPNYLVVGLLIGCGALFKWPIYLLWVIIVIAGLFCRWLFSWRMVLGVLLSLLGLLPSVYWNATHEWSTFRHVLATVSGGHAEPKVGALISGNVLDFIGAQAALMSPVLFILLIMALFALVKEWGKVPRGVVFCGSVTGGILLIAICLSIFMKIQGNWAIFTYPTAFVLVGWYGCDWIAGRMKWMVGGVVISVFLCAFVFSIPRLQAKGSVGIPYKINPFRHNLGWENLSKELHRAGYDPNRDFLFSDKYQVVSILSFYGENQKRAYFFNLSGVRKNQFSFWPGMDKEQVGNRGYFVAIESIPMKNEAEFVSKYQLFLNPHFGKVKFLGATPIFYANGKPVKAAFIFEGEDYLGTVVKDPDLY